MKSSFKATLRTLGAAAFATAIPVLAFAQGTIPPTNTSSGTKNLSDLVIKIIGYLNQFLVLLMAVAVLVFVWHIFQYYIKPNDDRAKAGSYVMYSLLGFFVIFSMWGLVNILSNTFGIRGAAPSASDLNSLFPGGTSNSSNTSPTYTNFGTDPGNEINSNP